MVKKDIGSVFSFVPKFFTAKLAFGRPGDAPGNRCRGRNWSGSEYLVRYDDENGGGA